MEQRRNRAAVLRSFARPTRPRKIRPSDFLPKGIALWKPLFVAQYVNREVVHILQEE